MYLATLFLPVESYFFLSYPKKIGSKNCSKQGVDMNKMLVLVLLIVAVVCLKKYYCSECTSKKAKQKVEKVADIKDIIEIQHDKVNFSEAQFLGDQQQV
jgi:hypothetical protein